VGKILRNKWFKFSIILIITLLMIIWIGNYWLLLGLPILFDLYISKKVHWTFWKKKGIKKQSTTIEWIDAIIFAVVAATIIRMFFIEAYTIPTSSMEKSMLVGDYLFVSKVAYGPKMPNTPLSFPFAHHTLPGTKSTNSYSELIKRPYKRLGGFGEVKLNDVVVFNFPAGDTVWMGNTQTDIYSLLRFHSSHFRNEDKQKQNKIQSNSYYNKMAYQLLESKAEIKIRPVDKRENYIKRCVALPGDELTSRDGQLFVNGKALDNPEELQFNYIVETNGTTINPRKLDELNIAKADRKKRNSNTYILPLSIAKVEILKKFNNVASITRVLSPKGKREDVFPFSPNYNWNRDNFGPIVMPKKGESMEITTDNLPLYERIIRTYEGNKLEVINDQIHINNKPVTSYTFKMDYYWMMGDNRHMSADSRYWGFVPEDHIVGKASFIWLSLDKDKSFFNKIRWDRFFKSVK